MLGVICNAFMYPCAYFMCICTCTCMRTHTLTCAHAHTHALTYTCTRAHTVPFPSLPGPEGHNRMACYHISVMLAEQQRRVGEHPVSAWAAQNLFSESLSSIPLPVPAPRLSEGHLRTRAPTLEWTSSGWLPLP